MKAKAFALAGIVGSLALVGGANADFDGVLVELVDDNVDGLDTYRISVLFTDPTDILLAVGAIPGVGALSFTSDTDLFNDGGPFSGTKSEDFAQSPIGNARDSYVTIGASTFSPNDTDYSPGFAGSDGITNIIKGSSLSETDGGWFDSNPGTPTAGSSILIAQFTAASGWGGELTALANWQPAGPEGFISSQFLVIINEGVPAPGALALLGLAGLAGTRRRRG